MTNATVALITVPVDKQHRAGTSLGLGYLAATLQRQGIVTRLLVWDGDSLPEILETDVLIGVSVMFTKQIGLALALCRALKRAHPNQHISMGGRGADFLWTRILNEHPYVDSVAQFEAERSILELVHNLSFGKPGLGEGLATRRPDGSAVQGAFPLPNVQLDSLPFPIRDEEVLRETRHASILSSRGCSAHCTFCLSGNLANRYSPGLRWRPRAANNVLQEIKSLYHEHGVDRFSFVDDNFLGGTSEGMKRADELCDLIEQSGLPISFSFECRADEVSPHLFGRLRAVGLKHVLVGVESANQSELRLYGKKESLQTMLGAIATLRALHIQVSIGFIMFQPLSTFRSLEQNLQFLRHTALATSGSITNTLQLYEGSPLLAYYRRQGIVVRQTDYSYSYDFREPAIQRVLSGFRVLAESASPLFINTLRGIYDAQVTDRSTKKLEGELSHLSSELTSAALRLLDHPNDLEAVCSNFRDSA